MAGPNWKLEDDYKTVTVTFPTKPAVALKLSVSDVEEMLKNLGKFRAAMKPEIPKDYALGQKVTAIRDPAWKTEADLMSGGSLLHMRDPHFGWLHYMIPKEEAKKLVGYLQTQVETPPHAPKPSGIN